jgi:hypothetical protein
MFACQAYSKHSLGVYDSPSCFTSPVFFIQEEGVQLAMAGIDNELDTLMGVLNEIQV